MGRAPIPEEIHDDSIRTFAFRREIDCSARPRDDFGISVVCPELAGFLHDDSRQRSAYDHKNNHNNYPYCGRRDHVARVWPGERCLEPCHRIQPPNRAVLTKWGRRPFRMGCDGRCSQHVRE